MNLIRDRKGGAGSQSWKDFTDRNKVNLAVIHKSLENATSEPKEADDESPEIVGRFFEMLAREAGIEKDAPLDKDIQNLKRIVACIIDTEKENILTQDEAMAVVEFLMSKFVEKRLNRVIRRLVPMSGPGNWFQESKWFYTHHKLLK